MTREKIGNIYHYAYTIIADMLRFNNYGLSKRLHDAEDYHLTRSMGCFATIDRLTAAITDATQTMELSLKKYYFIHLYENVCALIIMHDFTEEDFKKFSELLKDSMYQHKLYGYLSPRYNMEASYEFEYIQCLETPIHYRKTKNLINIFYISNN